MASSHSQSPDNSSDSSNYVPGSCNIGPSEIKRRRIVMWLGCALSLVTLASYGQSHAGRMDRISIALPAFVFSIGFVQSRKKFCLAFGFMGAFDFGKVGVINKVANSEARSADRKTAINLLVQSLLLTAVIVAVTVLLG